MTHAPQTDPAQAAGSHASFPPAGRSTDPGHGGDASALGQVIVSRLFSAGLDLHFALALAGDGPAAQRLHHAVAELDEAIKDLRHLMLALSAPGEAAAPEDGTLVDIRSRRPAQAADFNRPQG